MSYKTDLEKIIVNLYDQWAMLNWELGTFPSDTTMPYYAIFHEALMNVTEVLDITREQGKSRNM